MTLPPIRPDGITTLGSRRDEIAKARAEREWAERTQPVIITGIRIPFWPLVWWIVGITAGVSLVHAILDWIIGAIVRVFFTGSPT